MTIFKKKTRFEKQVEDAIASTNSNKSYIQVSGHAKLLSLQAELFSVTQSYVRLMQELESSKKDLSDAVNYLRSISSDLPKNDKFKSVRMKDFNKTKEDVIRYQDELKSILREIERLNKKYGDFKSMNKMFAKITTKINNFDTTKV